MNSERIQIEGAGCRIWWGELEYGMVGEFSADTRDAAVDVLAEAEARLFERACPRIYGPINGNTMQKYRFVTGTDGSRAFPFEPENPSEWPDWWKEAAWVKSADYVSSRVKLLGTSSVGLEKFRLRIDAKGIGIRPLDLENYEKELRQLYPFLLERFSENFLFTPFTEEEFLTQYLPARPLADPAFIRIAERNGEICGIVFSYRDSERLIVKTLASRVPGLGALLLDEVHLAAKKAGCSEAVHALKHEDNASCRTSERSGSEEFRRYTLFQKGAP